MATEIAMLRCRAGPLNLRGHDRRQQVQMPVRRRTAGGQTGMGGQPKKKHAFFRGQSRPYPPSKVVGLRGEAPWVSQSRSLRRRACVFCDVEKRTHERRGIEAEKSWRGKGRVRGNRPRRASSVLYLLLRRSFGNEIDGHLPPLIAKRRLVSFLSSSRRSGSR